MTTIQPRSQRVSTVLFAGVGLFLAACGGGDSSGPGAVDNSLSPGQAKAVGATALTIEGGASGMENVLVLVDTSPGSAATKVSYQIAATGAGAAGAVSAPATALLPSPDGTTQGA